MKKIAAFATTTVLLVAAGTGAASAREPRPGDHRGHDDSTVQVVETPATDAADVEAPETEAAEVEAPETDAADVEAAEVEETEAAEVEAPETDAADVEAPEAPEAP
jgi:hypothetical protein